MLASLFVCNEALALCLMRLAAEKAKRLEVVRNGVAKKQEAAQKATADNNARKEERTWHRKC